MILRVWRGWAAADRAHLYPQHLTRSVLPKLHALPGFQGAYLLQRAVGDEVEFVVQSLWESMQAIERFAGPAPDVAVVEDEARAVLLGFDATVQHFDVLLAPTEP